MEGSVIEGIWSHNLKPGIKASWNGLIHYSFQLKKQNSMKMSAVETESW